LVLNVPLYQGGEEASVSLLKIGQPQNANQVAAEEAAEGQEAINSPPEKDSGGFL